MIRNSALTIISGALLFIPCGLRAYAATPGVSADLRATTVPGTHPANGWLESTDTAALQFRADGQSNLSIPYDRITEIHLDDRTTVHLGVLPAIFVYLVAQPVKHHILSISYRDSGDATQVVTFEMGELQRNDMMRVLESRSKQACIDRGEFGSCQPFTSPSRTRLTGSH